MLTSLRNPLPILLLTFIFKKNKKTILLQSALVTPLWGTQVEQVSYMFGTTLTAFHKQVLHWIAKPKSLWFQTKKKVSHLKKGKKKKGIRQNRVTPAAPTILADLRPLPYQKKKRQSEIKWRLQSGTNSFHRLWLQQILHSIMASQSHSSCCVSTRTLQLQGWKDQGPGLKTNSKDKTKKANRKALGVQSSPPQC